MRKTLLISLIMLALLGIGDLLAQTGIVATNGVYVPRLSTANRNAIASPNDGQMIYNTDDNCFNFYRGGSWQKLCGYDVPVTTTWWTQKANLSSTGRQSAVAFTIGSTGYVGTGFENGNYKNDFWQYNPTTNVWSQRAAFGGGARYAAVGFAMGGKGYVGTGYTNPGGYKNDFWEYNPTNNTWTQKADFVGTPRQSAIGFSAGGKGYIGTGYDGATKSDFWEYDLVANGWTQKADFGGGIRYGAVGFSLNDRGYVGTGFDNTVNKDDFWEYNPSNNTWTQKATFIGGARQYATGFVAGSGSKGYVGTGYNGTTKADFYEYDAIANTWAAKASFEGTARRYAVGFSIGTKAYIGTGNDGVAKNDFWEYTPVPVQSTTMTQQGNDFNGPNQLVKLDGSAGFAGNLKVSGNLNINGQLLPVESQTAPTLLNGWVNYDVPNGYAAAAYYKDKKSLVYLKGIIKDGTTTSATVLFTLPVGYRPAEISVFAVLNGTSYGRVDIYPNGDVKIISGGNTSLSLDGIIFKAN